MEPGAYRTEHKRMLAKHDSIETLASSAPCVALVEPRNLDVAMTNKIAKSQSGDESDDERTDSSLEVPPINPAKSDKKKTVSDCRETL